MKTMIKYTMLNEDGRVTGGNLHEWTDTREEADKKVAEMKEKWGGFVYIIEVREADYDKFLEMAELEYQIEMLKIRLEQLELLF